MLLKTDVAIVSTDEEEAAAKQIGTKHIVRVAHFETSSSGLRLRLKATECNCSRTQVCDTCASWKSIFIGSR